MAGKAEAGGERKRNGRADASLGGDGPWCESTCCCYFVANVSVDAVASLNCSLLWYAACLVWSQCPLSWAAVPTGLSQAPAAVLYGAYSFATRS